MIFLFVITIVSLSEGKAQNWWEQGLVSHYAFDSISGVDSVPSGVNLNIGAQVTAVNNRFNRPQSAISFAQGSSGGSAIASHLPTGTSARSFSLWIRLNQLPSGNIPFESPFFYGAMLENQGQGLVIDANGTVSYAGYKSTPSSAADLSSITTINAAEWIHVGCSFEGDTAKLYINGQLDNSSFKSWNTASNRAINFGRMGFIGGGGQTGGGSVVLPYNGEVDDFRAYNRALSAEEFSKLALDDFSPLGSNVGLEESKMVKLVIYPNPVSQKLKLNIDRHVVTLNVWSLTGTLLLKEEGTEHEIEVSNLANGVYILEVVTDQGSLYNRFIKN